MLLSGQRNVRDRHVAYQQRKWRGDEPSQHDLVLEIHVQHLRRTKKSNYANGDGPAERNFARIGEPMPPPRGVRIALAKKRRLYICKDFSTDE